MAVRVWSVRGQDDEVLAAGLLDPALEQVDALDRLDAGLGGIMGIWDATKHILSGSGTKTLPVTLEPGELERARSVAGYRPGTLTSVGGDLVLTNRRLVFTPLDTRDAVEVLTWGLEKAGAPHVGTQLPGQLGDMIRQEQIRGVRTVEPGTNGSLFKPPTIRITGSDGSVIELAILAGRRSRNSDPANRQARDEMLAAIRTHLL